MRTKNPPPPKIGDVYSGREIGHGKPIRTGKAGKYYVRGIIDPYKDEDGEWQYIVIFRFWSLKYGGEWRYNLEDASALAFGLYKKISKEKRVRKSEGASPPG